MKQSPKYRDNLSKQKRFTPAQLKRLDEIEQHAIARFMGDLGELESALGMLRLGHQYGWRVMYLIHSKATVKKYEQILDIRVRDEFDEEGPSSMRNNGYRLVQNVSNFWKAASGEKDKLPGKRLVE